MSFGFDCYKCGTSVHMSSKKVEIDIPREKQLCLHCWIEEKDDSKDRKREV